MQVAICKGNWVNDTEDLPVYFCNFLWTYNFKIKSYKKNASLSSPPHSSSSYCSLFSLYSLYRNILKGSLCVLSLTSLLHCCFESAPIRALIPPPIALKMLLGSPMTPMFLSLEVSCQSSSCICHSDTMTTFDRSDHPHPWYSLYFRDFPSFLFLSWVAPSQSHLKISLYFSETSLFTHSIGKLTQFPRFKNALYLLTTPKFIPLVQTSSLNIRFVSNSHCKFLHCKCTNR